MTPPETARDLEASGVPTGDISMIANNADDRYARVSVQTGAHAGTGAGVGTVLGGGVACWRVSACSRCQASVRWWGWDGSRPPPWRRHRCGGGAATGGSIGSLTEAGVTEADAHVYAEGVRRGGTLLSVRAPTGLAQDVEAILHRHNPVDIDLRGETYRKAGWTAFERRRHPTNWRISNASARFRTPRPHPTTLER